MARRLHTLTCLFRSVMNCEVNTTTTLERVVTAWPAADHILSSSEEKFSVRGQFMEPEGPAMLGLNMLKGSLAGLSDPHSILLSQSVARNLFVTDDPMGQLLK